MEKILQQNSDSSDSDNYANTTDDLTDAIIQPLHKKAKSTSSRKSQETFAPLIICQSTRAIILKDTLTVNAFPNPDDVQCKKGWITCRANAQKINKLQAKSQQWKSLYKISHTATKFLPSKSIQQ